MSLLLTSLSAAGRERERERDALHNAPSRLSHDHNAGLLKSLECIYQKLKGQKCSTFTVNIQFFFLMTCMPRPRNLQDPVTLRRPVVNYHVFVFL